MLFMHLPNSDASIPARSPGRPGHDETLKEAALVLARDPKRKIAQIARTLDLPDSTVRGWVKEARKKQQDAASRIKGADESTPSQSTTPKGEAEPSVPAKPGPSQPIRIGG
jgi:transposase-like protein